MAFVQSLEVTGLLENDEETFRFHLREVVYF